MIKGSEVKVYISGQITGLTEPEYIKNFSEAAEMLKKDGFTPINPLDVIPECEDGCNSGLTFEDGRYMHAWQCYMKYDIIALLDCHAILPLSGWDKSNGAKLEMSIAKNLGLTVLHEDENGRATW